MPELLNNYYQQLRPDFVLGWVELIQSQNYYCEIINSIIAFGIEMLINFYFFLISSTARKTVTSS
jgi:hypothetical protein